MLSRGRLWPGDRGFLAGAFQVTVRTLENWRRQAKAPPNPAGRPPHTQERWRSGRAKVARSWRAQGRTVGWRKVYHALGGELSTYMVQVLLGIVKARRRRNARRRIERRRTSMRVHSPDAIWSVDATHLGRIEGRSVEGVTVKDVSTQKLLAVVAGPAATGSDLVRVLELARSERGATPLVVATDNGGGFGSEELDRHLERERIVHLINLPRTPQHNAWVEEAHGELKEEGDLGKGVRLKSLQHAAGILRERVVRLNGVRLRAAHGYRTADAMDAGMRPWYGRVRRERFYADACAAQERAVVGIENARARRMAEREAIFRTMEEVGLLSRTRSASLRAASNPKGFPTHHTAAGPIGVRQWALPV